MQIHLSEIIFIAGFVAYIVIRGVYEQRAKNNSPVVIRVDRAEKLLLVLMAVGALLLPIIYLSTQWFAFADYDLPRPAPFIGTAIMLGALWLFWRSHADLAENWSRTLEIREGHKLVTRGIYGRVRHPMYAAIWLFSLAQGLLLQNWLAGWSAFVAFAIMYSVRVFREERMMEERFGEEYRKYASRTGRLLPRIRN